MLLHDDWALATIIYGWFLAACYPDGSSHEDYLPFERFLAPKSYPAMLNTRKNARRRHPHMARTKTKARPSFPAHSAGRKNLRRTKCAARASCMSEDVPKSKLMADPDDYRAIDYPVFCSPAETPVTVERIRLMYSAFFSSAISSWLIRTSRRARTWAMDRAST